MRSTEEHESAQGTNHNYKFEIERTDSLEFTRNSVTGDGDESHARVLSSQSSRRGCATLKLKRSQSQQDLDRTQDQVKRGEAQHANLRGSTEHNLAGQDRHSDENVKSCEDKNLDVIKKTLIGEQFAQSSNSPAKGQKERVGILKEQL